MGAPGGPAHLVKGDVVLVPFPFSDLTATKLRPALVLVSLAGGDVILCQITSQLRTAGISVAITATDFVAGTLVRDSYVRPERLFTGASALTRRVGRLSDAKVQEVIAGIVHLLTT